MQWVIRFLLRSAMYSCTEPFPPLGTLFRRVPAS